MFPSIRLTSVFFVVTLVLGLAACTKQDALDGIHASGTVENREVMLASKLGGQLRKLLVDEGSVVKSGDTIAVLDTTDANLALRQAQAALAASEAQLQLLERGSRAEDIGQAEDAVRQATAQLQSAEADAARLQSLGQANAAPAKQVEDATTRVTIAKAAVSSASHMLQKLKNGARSEDVAAARAHANQLKAQTELLEQRVRDCAIVTTSAGTITRRVSSLGEFVAPGAPVAVLSVLDSVRVTIYIPEKTLSAVRFGMTAQVTSDGNHEHPLQGTVSYVSPTAEFTPRNVQMKDDREKLVYAVRITVPNPAGELKPGMPVDAVLK